MSFEFYFCDTAGDLIAAESQLPQGASVLYRTPGAAPETGDVVRYPVSGTIGPAQTLTSYAGKFVLLARV